jgi:hypothetical protein
MTELQAFDVETVWTSSGTGSSDVVHLREDCQATNHIETGLRPVPVETRFPDTAVCKACERQHGDSPDYKDPDWLRDQYVIQGKSMYQLGEQCGVSGQTIRYWIQKHNIETREQTARRMGGDDD